MLINQVKYMHQEAWTGGKEYIVSALFKYLDADANGLLTEEELNKVSANYRNIILVNKRPQPPVQEINASVRMLQVSKRVDLRSISNKCYLKSLISREDIDKDNRLGSNEFYAAFSKLYSEYEIFSVIT